MRHDRLRARKGAGVSIRIVYIASRNGFVDTVTPCEKHRNSHNNSFDPIERVNSTLSSQIFELPIKSHNFRLCEQPFNIGNLKYVVAWIPSNAQVVRFIECDKPA